MSEEKNYAVIKSGTQQYRVSEGEIIDLQLLEANKGDSVTFDQVLATGCGEAIKVGTPTVEGASVSAKVLGTKKEKKIIIFKHKRRKNHRKRTGHRQNLMQVQIDKISV